MEKPQETLLRLQSVESRTGLRKSKLYGLIKEGKFPAPIALTPKNRAWIGSEVDGWIQGRIAASRGQGHAA